MLETDIIRQTLPHLSAIVELGWSQKITRDVNYLMIGTG